ncbi:MAG: cytochrome c [Flavobacteriales bacterium]|nr:cytochrome c [Flavobacteriales bacterium]MDW8432077.1 cytochrome c [Flavobacteriales bacterium]
MQLFTLLLPILFSVMSYASIKTAHLIVVNIFLLIYLVKLGLLLLNSKKLEVFTKAFRIPEMLVSVLFLASGGYMLTEKPEVSTLQIVKLILVFASIPMAVVGFKKKIKTLAALSVLMIVAAYGLAEMNKKAQTRKKDVATEVNRIPGTEGYSAEAHGELLYQKQLNCVSCHGPQGDAMIAGAPNLKKSVLTESEIIGVVRHGRGMMPPYKDLNEEELKALAVYVKNLQL